MSRTTTRLQHAGPPEQSADADAEIAAELGAASVWCTCTAFHFLGGSGYRVRIQRENDRGAKREKMGKMHIQHSVDFLSVHTGSLNWLPTHPRYICTHIQGTTAVWCAAPNRFFSMHTATIRCMCCHVDG